MKIQVRLHANSSQEKIIDLGGSKYEIWLKEKPIDGKANLVLIKFLKKHFKCRDVKIKSGFSSRFKVVEIL